MLSKKKAQMQKSASPVVAALQREPPTSANQVKRQRRLEFDAQLDDLLDFDVDAAVARAFSRSDDALLVTLKTNFGLDQLRPGQGDVIRAIHSGQDCAVYWPTGSSADVLKAYT